jgi:hypothetical protein
LTQIPGSDANSDIIDVELPNSQKRSYARRLSSKIINFMGYEPQPQVLKNLPSETVAPPAFSYSLFYIYYDQYTYISGILAQNSLLGVAAVILALQVKNIFHPNNPKFSFFLTFISH